jgi:hypothetical protein
MHLRFRNVLQLAALALPLAAESADAHRVTVVLDFQEPYSSDALAQMKREMQGLLKDAGVSLDWKTLQEAVGNDDGDMVVVRFNGKCILKPLSYLYYDERGPLAHTYSSDGKVLPFSEVSCDHVAASVRSALFGGDYAHADLLLGRALGRVVAHELMHVLTRSGEHEREGVCSEALSGKQLISETLPFCPQEVKRMQTERRPGL